MDKKDINQFNEILNYFRNQKYDFTTNLIIDIKKSILILFPNLNNQDSEVLYLFTENLIEKIANYNDFDKTKSDYYKQWTQNNYRDIKGVVLLLLPFIDDKQNGKLLTDMIDLNQFFYAKITNTIPDLSDIDRNDLLKTDFKFSNMSLGLLNLENQSTMLNLYENDLKLVYKTIHHNYLGLLKTLEIMNSKYYVNWINVVPILLEDYKVSNIYKKTMKGLDDLKTNLTDNNTFVEFKNNYYGLYLGDIYNVVRIKLYQEIKHIKWMLFTVAPQKYIIHYLNESFSFDSFFKYNNYEDIDDKSQFQKEINNINISTTFEIWKQILLFLCNDYSKKTMIKNVIGYDKFSFEKSNKYKQTDFTDEDGEDDFTKIVKEKIESITIKDVQDFLQNIEIKHIWNFLYESLQKLKSTYLRDYLIKNNKITSTYFYQGLSFKNIYNIAKSLTHYSSKWLSMEDNYVSFTFIFQKIFFDRFLNNNDFNTWLKLRNNINREYGNINYYLKINEIYTKWNNVKIDLIFEILIKNGLLTKFQPALDITDKKAYLTSEQMKPQILKKMSSRMKKNLNWRKAYYYLTNDTYENLKKIRYEDEKTKTRLDYDYFDLFGKDQNWYSFYAMDWLAQVNFFNHYINHRVLYVTGATGQGKSTQVPKLLMYALKAYEMKNDGKVVCTQPRIPPTTGNSSRISTELGLPIVQVLEKGAGELKTDNFYVQMKYSDDSHTKEKCPHLTLKILTDGTLYEELQQNPMMKEQIHEAGKKDFVYGLKNHYDVIILDESHEHNTNMDMILTLTRQSCFYNNSLRLIIMSATMDEDEPVYRSYFRSINDNLVYPIKSDDYIHPILKITFQLDTIYMDRRFHISPPGETTQYIVTEYYTENLPIETLPDKNASVLVQEESYQRILEICQKYPTGEILFFLTGQAEINKAIERLNQILPQGNIALPYYSSLHPNYKDIIEKIDRKIFTIKTERERVFLDWGENYIEDNKVPDGKYQRAIIVATNVAEASITINTLKFVVDTGYAKTNAFNDITRLTQLNVEKISEASRVQRKGRVGRVGDGTAYFIYPKGSREKIQPKYKITQEDQSNLYLKLSIDENSSNSDEPIIPEEFNPNIYSNFKLPKQIRPTFNKRNVFNILKTQYSINNNLIKSENFWNPTFYPIKLVNNSGLERVYSGQFISNLADTEGNFYIIHPKENLLKRNINNQIIEFMDVKVKEIPDYIFFKDIEILEERLILVNKNYSSNVFSKNLNINDLAKTELYTKINDLQKALSDNTIDVNDCLTIFASIGFNCFEEVVSIISLIKTTNSVSGLIHPDYISNFYSKWYSSTTSELIILYNIYMKIKSNIPLEFFKIQQLTNKINAEIKETISNFKKYYIPFSNKVNDKFKDKLKLWNLLRRLYNSGKLENKNGLEELKKYFLTDFIKKDIIKNEFNIKLWCEQNFIRSDIIILYLTNLANISINIKTIERNIDTELDEKSPLLWINDIKSNFNKTLKTNDIKEKILKSFIIGRPLNFAIKLDFKNNYYSMIEARMKGILPPNKYLPQEMSNILFFYNYTDNKGLLNLNLVNNIDLDYFTSCIPQIFNKIRFKKILPITSHTIIKNDYFKENKGFLEITGSNYDSIVNFINNNSLASSPWENNLLPLINDYLKKLRNN